MALFQEGKSFQERTSVSSHRKPVDIEVQEIDDKSDFKDAAFPPSLNSLLGQRRARDVEAIPAFQKMKGYQWLRMRDLKDKKPELFLDGVSPNDVNQGALANCYFLSSVSAIAEYPERIERLFYPKKFSPSGKYIVALCVTGEWLKVEVDDYLPIDPASNFALAFAMTKNFEVWASLLEKAYAKAYGGYAHIGSVDATVAGALYTLTGAPTFNCLHAKYKDKLDSLIQILQEADLKKYIIVSSSGEEERTNGIIKNLSYTFLSIFKIDQNRTLVKMRNPWGQGEWNGDWSDKSSLWTPELKQKVNYQNNVDDGVFYMDFRDFFSSFSLTTIAHYREEYFSSSYNTDLPDNSDLFLQFEVAAAGEYYFGVCQASNKHFVAMDYKYGLVSFVVGMQNGAGQWEYVASAQGTRANKHDLGAACKPGKYLVIIYANWESACDDISFNVYGPQQVKISSVVAEANRQKAYEYIARSIEHKILKLDKQDFPAKDPAEVSTCIIAKIPANYVALFVKNISGFDYGVQFKNLTSDQYIYPMSSHKPKNQLPSIPLANGKSCFAVARAVGNELVDLLGYDYKFDDMA